MLYYSYPQVVVEEVPDEIALAISISGCNLACKGCHSAETWNPTFGKELTVEAFTALLDHHKHITCVLFYGGEWQPSKLEELFKICKAYNLKISLYTGLNYEEVEPKLLPYLYSIKVGR